MLVKLLRHKDKDVKLLVTLCISGIMRNFGIGCTTGRSNNLTDPIKILFEEI
jgi:hypothetical protein